MTTVDRSSTHALRAVLARAAVGLVVMVVLVVLAAGCAVPPVPDGSPVTTTTTSTTVATTSTTVRSGGTTVVPRPSTTRPPVTTVPPPPTTSTTLLGADRVTRLGQLTTLDTGCARTDLYSADVDRNTGTVQLVCRDAGRLVLHTLVVDAGGRLPRQTGTIDLGVVSEVGDWTASVEIVEPTDRTFVLAGSTVHVFETSTMRSLGTSALSVSGITLLDSADQRCDGSAPTGVVYVAARDGRAVLSLDASTGAELVRRDFVGRVLSLGVSAQTGRVAVGVAQWPGMNEFVLDPTTLAVLSSRVFEREANGNFNYARVCDAGGDLTRFENSAKVTTVDTASGSTSYWLPNPSFESTQGPVAQWAGSDFVRVTQSAVQLTSPSFGPLATVRVAGQYDHASMGDLSAMAWQQSERLSLFWVDGSIEVFCLDGSQTC